MKPEYIVAVIALISIVVNMATMAFNLKLYTEIMKEKSQRQRPLGTTKEDVNRICDLQNKIIHRDKIKSLEDIRINYIVRLLIEAFTAKRGFGWEWEQLEPETRRDIIKSWGDIIKNNQ